MKEINISEIDGIDIGIFQDIDAGTGCTAIIAKDGGVASCSVRGGGPATRETDILSPEKTVEKIHGIMLSGGSAFGLESGSGLMKYLEEKKIGFQIENFKDIFVPIVTGASIFDLNVGSSVVRPDFKMGYLAGKNSEIKKSNKELEGNVGAGTGASVGKLYGNSRAMKSGQGVYAISIGDLKLGAISIVNAIGNIYDYEEKKMLAGLLNEERDKIISTSQELEKILTKKLENQNNQDKDDEKKKREFNSSLNQPKNFDLEKENQLNQKENRENTTITCIITNAKLSKLDAKKICNIAHNGYARTICPVHTSLDGDSIFLISTCQMKETVDIDIMGLLATEVVGRAINRGVITAKSSYGLRSYEELLEEINCKSTYLKTRSTR